MTGLKISSWVIWMFRGISCREESHLINPLDDYMQ